MTALGLVRRLPHPTRAVAVTYVACFAALLASLVGGTRYVDEAFAVLGGIAALLGACLLGDVRGSAHVVVTALLTDAPPTRGVDRLQRAAGRLGVVRAVGAVLVVAGACQALAGTGHLG